MKTLILLISGCFAAQAVGVIPRDRNQKPYHFDLDNIKRGLEMNASAKPVSLAISADLLKTRIQKSKVDQKIEAVSLTIPERNSDIATLAKKIAKPGKVDKTALLLLSYYRTSKEPLKQDRSKKVSLDHKSLKVVDLKRLGVYLAHSHQDVAIDTSKVSSETKKDFIKQIERFLPEKKVKEIAVKMTSSPSLSLSKDLLPPFAKKMIGKYTLYKGPNCFHASLAFHDENLGSSAFINVRKEEGYHRYMINYDELSRVIQRQFYEIDPSETPLLYGDLVLFFELPTANENTVYYKWMRHATTYLFDDYTFSKGSKSPDTPYSIKTLTDEWGTWKKMGKHMAFKVYRRAHTTEKLPKDLIDWIY